MSGSQQKTVNPANATVNGSAAITEIVTRKENQRSLLGNYYPAGLGESSLDIFPDEPVYTNITDMSARDLEVFSVFNLAGTRGEKLWKLQSKFRMVGICGGDGFKYAQSSSQIIERPSPKIAIIVGGLKTIEWKGTEKVRKGDWIYWELKPKDHPNLVLSKEEFGRIYPEYKIYKPDMSETLKSKMSAIALDDAYYRQIKDQQDLPPVEDGLKEIVKACLFIFSMGAYFAKGAEQSAFETAMVSDEQAGLIRKLLFSKDADFPEFIEKHRKETIHSLWGGVQKAQWDILSRVFARSLGNAFCEEKVTIHIGNFSH